MTSASVVMGPSLNDNGLFQGAHSSGITGPSVMIRDLCRECHYSSMSYDECAEKLKSFGFECLRLSEDSRCRSSEVWVLHELCAARGALKDYLKVLCVGRSLPITREQMHEILRFIFEHAPYDTACVSVCYVCMVSPIG